MPLVKALLVSSLIFCVVPGGRLEKENNCKCVIDICNLSIQKSRFYYDILA